MPNTAEIYDLLLDHAAASEEAVREVLLGLTWTLCRGESGIGLAMSPAAGGSLEARSLPWPRTLAGRRLAELAGWIRSWDPYAATVGMAAVNAALAGNETARQLMAAATPLAAGNLAVFDHFRPFLAGKKWRSSGAIRGWTTGLKDST